MRLTLSMIHEAHARRQAHCGDILEARVIDTSKPYRAERIMSAHSDCGSVFVRDFHSGQLFEHFTIHQHDAAERIGRYSLHRPILPHEERARA